jgi:hypothetical protein
MVQFLPTANFARAARLACAHSTGLLVGLRLSSTYRLRVTKGERINEQDIQDILVALLTEDSVQLGERAGDAEPTFVEGRNPVYPGAPWVAPVRMHFRIRPAAFGFRADIF